MQLRRRRALYSALIATAVLLGAGCASEVRERPRAEWATTVSSEKAAPIPLHARRWKDIQVGTTTREEVDKRFAPTKRAGESAALYRIDQIDSLITYGKASRVVSIQMVSATDFDLDRAVAHIGEPDRQRNLGGLRRALDYDAAGLTVEYERPSEAPKSVEIHMPIKPRDAKTDAVFDAFVPIRPPLTDLPRRVAAVRLALTTGSEGFSWVGVEREHTQAQSLYEQMQAKDMLVNETDLQLYLDRLVARLGSVTPENHFEWKIGVMKGALPNAMNPGGGFVFVTPGLLEYFDTEAEFAYAISHEMAHQLKGHVAVGQTRADIAGFLIMAAAIGAGVATGSPYMMRAIENIGGAAGQAALAPFSREQESEADLIAMDIIFFGAGYDPREAVKAMGRLKTVRDKYGGEISLLAQHPAIEDRERVLEQWLQAHPDQDYSRCLTTTQEYEAIRAGHRVSPW